MGTIVLSILFPLPTLDISHSMWSDHHTRVVLLRGTVNLVFWLPEMVYIFKFQLDNVQSYKFFCFIHFVEWINFCQKLLQWYLKPVIFGSIHIRHCIALQNVHQIYLTLYGMYDAYNSLLVWTCLGCVFLCTGNNNDVIFNDLSYC